ncbi:MAG TPA: HAMP domain-containing sensor histidine kinase [Polyangia bacterium]|jgi:signal transduction histidine kinase
MRPLYSYSLLPVLAVALLLFFTAARRGRRALGLSAYCLAVAVWCASLWLCCLPSTAPLGRRLAASGAFVVAAYCHLAYDATDQPRYGLVWVAYASALLITLAGALLPGVLYDPVTFTAGALFWPGLALAAGAALLPLSQLVAVYRRAPRERRGYLRTLFASGLAGLVGAWANAVLLTRHLAVPWGLYIVLASLLLLGHAVGVHEPLRERRLLERSLLYGALAALLSGAYLFGVMTLVSSSAEPLLTQHRLGAFLLLVMAAVAFEPLRQQLQERIGRRLLRGRVSSGDLAHELAAQEARADQAARLAELGAFTSAVAHEIRNPLGVVSVQLRVLERDGAAPEVTGAIREQVRRAERFVEDLLRYGRPRPLELRVVDLEAILELAVSTARDGLGLPCADVEVTFDHGAALLEADQAQLLQAVVIVIDNALLELREAPRRRLRVGSRTEGEHVKIIVEDSGPGLPPEILPRLFQPFVSGRKRDGGRAGTGLGLAIVKGIIERHGGRVAAGRSELGGARFELDVPRHQTVLGARSAP